jgi:hypothetical protein
MQPDAMERLQIFRGNTVLLKVRASAQFHLLGAKNQSLGW